MLLYWLVITAIFVASAVVGFLLSEIRHKIKRDRLACEEVARLRLVGEQGGA